MDCRKAEICFLIQKNEFTFFWQIKHAIKSRDDLIEALDDGDFQSLVKDFLLRKRGIT